jgi:hypothetical protein
MRRYWRKILLALVVLAIIMPLFYYGTPYCTSSPDICYVKAKVLHVMEGDIFADPVSGYDTLHPPLYHIFLGFFKAFGLSLDTILMLVTIFNVSLLFVFTFKIIEYVYDRAVAFLTSLLLLFIVEYMGYTGILLATSFYFSVSFYLCGLWLYLKSEKSLRLSIMASVFWGLTFFISPVYVFLLGLTFLYELLIARRYKRFLVMAAVFLVTISPYIIEAVHIYASDLWGSAVFTFWRGIPNMAWWKGLCLEFISPTKGSWLSIPSAIHILFLLLAVAAIVRQRKVHWFIPVAALAYFLTSYHFSTQYAIRIHLFLSIFIIATALAGLKHYKINRHILLLPVLVITVFSVYWHYDYISFYYEREKATFAPFQESGESLWANLNRHLVKGRYIFCTKDVYRYYIMTHFPAHSLGAYRTLEYFQLNSRVAEMLDNDYHAVINSADYEPIESIADKYNIETAIVSGDDWQAPLFQVIAQLWTPVYEDEYFVIYKRPWEAEGTLPIPSR